MGRGHLRCREGPAAEPWPDRARPGPGPGPGRIRCPGRWWWRWRWRWRRSQRLSCAAAEGGRSVRRPRAARSSSSTTASSFEQAFRAIDDCLRKEADCGTELDYTEQTSWLLFHKYLDGLEDDRAAVAALESRSYSPILEEPYRWSRWAAPKNASGQLDHHTALTGDDLRDCVNAKLFTDLERFKQSASGPNTIEYKIGEIFGELCSLASGDIVFARTGASTGKSFLVEDPPDAVFASYLIRLRLLDEILLPQFVLMYFQTADYWRSIKDGSSRSAQGRFNATKLGALKIPLHPLPEQQRIVVGFRSLAAETERLTRLYERKLAALEELKKSLLQQAFNGEL